MTRSLLNQELGILPLFQPGYFGVDFGFGEDVSIVHIVRPEPQKLLEFKGPLANDKQLPHDVATRAAANRTYRKPKLPIAEQAKRWMESHPKIYELFVRFALEAIRAGRTRIGAKAICERIRWETNVVGGSDFKVLNGAVTYMAIRFIEEHPQHAGLFSIHKRK